MSSTSTLYIEMITSMGSDRSIIEAARMSTGRGFKGWSGAPCANFGVCNPVTSPGISGKIMYNDECPMCAGTGVIQDGKGDEKLLEYLYKNKHTSPFEMCEIVFEVHCPIFVAREWMRHRTFSYNEMSGRYIELPNEYYAPDLFRKQSASNKQGGDATYFDREEREKIEAEQEQAHMAYSARVANGMEKGIARLNLPVALMTRFRVKGNLRNWMHFMDQRCRPNALQEIRVLANAVRSDLTKKFPRSMALWEEWTFGAMTLSKTEWARIKRILENSDEQVQAT